MEITGDITHIYGEQELLIHLQIEDGGTLAIGGEGSAVGVITIRGDGNILVLNPLGVRTRRARSLGLIDSPEDLTHNSPRTTDISDRLARESGRIDRELRHTVIHVLKLKSAIRRGIRLHHFLRVVEMVCDHAGRGEKDRGLCRTRRRADTLAIMSGAVSHIGEDKLKINGFLHHIQRKLIGLEEREQIRDGNLKGGTLRLIGGIDA